MKTLIFFFFSCLITFAQIGSKVQSVKPNLAGNWVNNSFGFEMKLVLSADGNGSFDGEKITYSSTPTNLSIKENGETTNYQYKLNGNILILSGGDLDAPITFSKGGSVAVSQPNTIPTNTSNPTNSINSNLIGTWSANGESVTFNTDKTGIYNGNRFNYSVSGNTLTTSDNTGSTVFSFSVNGNYLTLSGGGVNIVMQKGITNTSQSNTYGQNSAGGIDQSIVGKWCFVKSLNNTNATSSSSRCLVINGNGTYEYYAEGSISGYGGGGYGGSSSQSSDRGTWKLAGNQISVQSQAEGYKVYSFEKRNHPKNGDPMIIIDGDPYVTYYQKAPWR